MRPIKEGDTVTVVMTQAGKCFDFQAAAEIYRVTVLHRPAQPGDLWYFRIGELEFAVNPSSSDFVGLILEAGADDCPNPCPGCEATLGAGKECRISGGNVTLPSPTCWMDWPGRARIIGSDDA